MEYTIFILLLPLLSFLVLGIGGKWMTHRTAGIIGTTVLAVVALLSYATAWQYFSAPRLADGTFATLMPYNVTWLPFTSTLSIDLGILLDPISVMMLIVISTVSLMVHVYSFGYMKGERGFQRIPQPLYHVHVGSGGGYQYLPDVSVLGIGGCFVLLAHRFLLYETVCCCCKQESVHCYPFCRPGFPDRYPYLRLLCRNLHLPSQ